MYTRDGGLGEPESWVPLPVERKIQSRHTCTPRKEKAN